MKKTLAIFLCLILLLSSASAALASVATVDNVAKNFDIGTSKPVTSESGATFADATDGTESVWQINTTSGDYNIWFNNASNNYSVSEPFAVSYDVKITSFDSTFDLKWPVFAPNFQANSGYFFEYYLPSAYCDSAGNVTFKAREATGSIDGYTNIGTFQGNLNKWYTIKLCFAPSGTLKSYVIDRETGNSALISQMTYTDTITSVRRLNITARGKAKYLFDNLKIYNDVVDASSITVNSFDTQNGLNLTVKLSDDVKKAELKADGVLLETIENTGSGIYKVTNNSLNATVKEYELELLCYDSSGNVVETVSNITKPSIILTKDIKSEPGEVTIATGGTNILDIGDLRKSQAVIETQYDVQFTSSINKFEQYSKHFDSTGANGFGAYFNVPYAEANTTDWYTVRVVYDSKNYVYEAFINDGNGEKLIANGTLNANGRGIGYYLTQLVATGSPKIKNAVVRDIFHINNGTSLLSYVNYLGTASEIEETIPSNAKAVNISLGDLALSSTDGVKLYKDSVEVTGVTKTISDGVLTVEPAAFEAGSYKVSVSGTTYGGEATNLVFEEEFEVEEFELAQDGLYISNLKIVKGDTAGTYKAELNYYNYTEAAQDGILVIASYSDNTLEKVAFSLNAEFATGYGTLNAEISGVASGETVKAMLWNNTSALTPLTGSLAITAE